MIEDAEDTNAPALAKLFKLPTGGGSGDGERRLNGSHDVALVA